MSENQHQKSAYAEMCELHKETFGFKASKVVSLLESWGMLQGSQRHARRCTTKYRDDIKAALEAEIVRLDAEGLTVREIAETLDCPESTVGDVLSVRKRTMSETGQEERLLTKRNSCEMLSTADTKPPHGFHDETLIMSVGNETVAKTTA